ncbi:ComEC/Rec2 family competence protein [Sinorhizobium sp. CB9]
MSSEEEAHGHTFLFVPVCIGTGAVIWFKTETDFSAIALTVAVLVCFCILFVSRDAELLVKRTVWAGLLVLLGMVLSQVETWRSQTVVLDSAVTTTLTGRVERRETSGQGRWRYILALEKTELPAIKRPPRRISVISRGMDLPFEIGDTLTGRARLVPPAGPALPLLNDFAFSAYFDSIGANGYFYGAPQRVPRSGADTEEPRMVAVEKWLHGLRAGIGDRIRSILPGDTGAFAAALVTDERRAISEETTEALRISGLAHIIAISGLNMALSAGIFFIGFRSVLSLLPGMAQAYPTKKIAAFGALVAVTAYFLISGFGVSAERAFIMMAIMLIAVFFDRPSLSLRNVALSAIVILVLSPSEVLGPSFQMSFAATLALIAGYAVWKDRPAHTPFHTTNPALLALLLAARFFGGILLTSLIGGLSTAVFAIEHFHRLATYGLAANLAAMPVITFIVMPAGLFAMLLMPFGLDPTLWKVVGFGLDLVIAIAKTIADWGGNIDVGRLPSWFFPVMVGGFLLLTLLRTKLRHTGTLTLAIALILVCLVPPAPQPDMLISEDGGLVAVIHDDELATNRDRPPSFIFEQWQHALAISQHRRPKTIDGEQANPSASSKSRRRLDAAERQQAREAMRAATEAGTDRGFVCAKRAWCTTKLPNGKVVTTIDDAAYLGPACDTAQIVITSIRLRFDRCRSGAALFTGETLRKTGAVEIRFDQEGPVIKTAFDTLERPWNRHRAYDWRSDRFTEQATLETPASINDSDE